jgi:dihydrofolate reductase
MTKITADISISLDGFASGPNQRLDAPFGDGHLQEHVHRWMFDEPEKHRPVLDAITSASAFIMGRNMFSPGRGAWDPDWTGWWGDDPPYHAPVFVLSHHSREPIEMQGGTTFNFVTDGIESALAQAREAAGDGDISIAGGAATLNQYLAARAVDELRLHVVPFVVGGTGARVFEGVAGLELDLLGVSGSDLVTHLTYRVRR